MFSITNVCNSVVKCLSDIHGALGWEFLNYFIINCLGKKLSLNLNIGGLPWALSNVLKMWCFLLLTGGWGMLCMLFSQLWINLLDYTSLNSWILNSKSKSSDFLFSSWPHEGTWMCLAVYVPFDPNFSIKNRLVQTVLQNKVSFILLHDFGMLEPWFGFWKTKFISVFRCD